MKKHTYLGGEMGPSVEAIQDIIDGFWAMNEFHNRIPGDEKDTMELFHREIISPLQKVKFVLKQIIEIEESIQNKIDGFVMVQAKMEEE